MSGKDNMVGKDNMFEPGDGHQHRCGSRLAFQGLSLILREALVPLYLTWMRK
jgi:hypothetical protein